jgi:hypothetical protein
MNKKSYLLFVIAFFLSQITFAQNFSLGVRGGISIPDLTAGGSQQNPLNTDYKSRFGPDGGIFGSTMFPHYSQ